MLGQFIEPDVSIETSNKVHEDLNLQVRSGYRAMDHTAAFRGQNSIFDAIAERMRTFDIPYEDQCSTQYYFDVMQTLRSLNGEFDRVIEVGVFMGGSSALFAGCIDKFDFDLDLIDINAEHLRFSYERIRRTFPEAAGRVRLFHGDVTAYVKNVMLPEAGHGARSIVHHDGSHEFGQVVTDLAALSFAKDCIHSIIAQDTHLRGSLRHMNFVDMALLAVFGGDLNYMPIGKVYKEGDCTSPDRWFGNYFMPGVAEGMVLPMALNSFKYPHPSARLEDVFPPAA